MQPAAEFAGLNLARMQEIAESGDQEWQIYLAAQEYAKAGIHVVPLVGKRLPPKEHAINYGTASNKMSTIEKWFHPMEGRFAGWNIGIATGKTDGIFAIDVDRHGKADGFIELDHLESEFSPLPDGPSQTTPNGGKHFIYQWQDNLVNSTGKIAKGIDTRGGAEKACKGHIVVFPSIVDGKRYEWQTGGPLPFVPQWVMEKMGIVWKARALGTGRGNEGVGEDDEERQIPLEQLERMLTHVDPNDLSYDEWLRVGQAINSQHQGDDGLAVWDKWSQQGDRYKANECQIRWNGFDPTGPIRVGSIFYYAKEAGWEPKRKDMPGNKFDELIERMNRTYGVVVVGGKIRIIREHETVADPILGHYDLLGVTDFKILLENDIIWVETNRGDKPVSIAKVWLAHEGRRTYPNGMGLFPDGDRPGYYNTWNGFTVTPREGDCSYFLEHVKEIVCAGNGDHYNWLLDWVADAVQNPAEPKGTAIVMRGDEGAGKGTLADTVGRLFGNHYRHLIDDSHLLGNFNAHMLDALFVYADEITWGGNKKTSGKLKGMVTETYLIGERKGVDAVAYRNMTRMMIASNSEWIIPAGANSRRWFVLDVKDDYTTDEHYFNNINDQLDNGGREAFLYMMLNREVTVNLRRAPETEVLQEQRIRSMASDSILQWWINAIELRVLDVPSEDEFKPGEENGSDWPEQVAKPNLFATYERWSRERQYNIESLPIFYKKIKKLGIVERRIGSKPEDRQRVFVIPAIGTAIIKLKESFNIELETNDEG